MFRRLLVISDNVHMCSNFNLAFDNLNLKEVAVNYAISPQSNKTDFEKEFQKEVLVINLKNANEVIQIINSYDLIFSIHCKQLFPKDLVNSVKCINVHPGFNPTNRGWYPQVFSIIYDLPIGATIHEIDEYLDHGDIIDRTLVEKNIIDNSETLYAKILTKEIELINKNLLSIIHNNYSTIVPENKGNLYLKSDFNKLCLIDLNEKVNVGEFINRLRALSHGDHKNAFFIDKKSGKKVYIKIDTSYE